jgi:hypothetical protein
MKKTRMVNNAVARPIGGKAAIGERVMNNQDFSARLTGAKTPPEAFDAINNVRGWSSGNIEGGTEKLGDEFTYRYKDVHFAKSK